MCQRLSFVFRRSDWVEFEDCEVFDENSDNSGISGFYDSAIPAA